MTSVENILDKILIEDKKQIFHNLTYEQIRNHEIDNEEGVICSNEAYCCDTGIFTGRSPLDRYFVQQNPSQKNIWWGDVNQPCSPETFTILKTIVSNHYQDKAKKIYIFDGYCGASKTNRIHVRIISEIAWQHHFVSNMFIRPSQEELLQLRGQNPDFTIINACRTTYKDYQTSGLHSE
ncbi:unnamed protein product, partial [marine sediment metagenome]